jgi:tetratricopeptide (TPR) repeat protein
MNLEADGQHVVVRDGATSWRADSGQGLLSFAGEHEISSTASHASGTPVAALRPLATAPHTEDSDAPLDVAATATGANGSASATAEEFYALGCTLEEDGAPEAARVAYLNVLRLCPGHADAHVNLGRLMHESGDLEFAEEHYRTALSFRPEDPAAFFNLGVVLEDRGRPDAAIETYEAALRVDPTHAGAHFNAARLHDLAGRYEAALRHLRAYRDLTETT